MLVFVRSVAGIVRFWDLGRLFSERLPLEMHVFGGCSYLGSPLSGNIAQCSEGCSNVSARAWGVGGECFNPVIPYTVRGRSGQCSRASTDCATRGDEAQLFPYRASPCLIRPWLSVRFMYCADNNAPCLANVLPGVVSLPHAKSTLGLLGSPLPGSRTFPTFSMGGSGRARRGRMF